MKQSIPTITSKPTLSNPRDFLSKMVIDLKKSRYIAWRLMMRDINAKYRQTLLGYFWALIPPIVVTYGLVMATQAKVINVGETAVPYPAYVILSMVLWQTFLEAFNAPSAAVIEAKTMLAKINFPRESIILAKVGEVFFNFLIKLVLVVYVFVVYKIQLKLSLFLVPIGILSLVVLGTFLGLLIAPFGAIYQDIAKGLVLLTTPWMFITPIFYTEPKNGAFATLVNLNPVTHLLVTTREWLTTGVASNLNGFIFVSALSILGLLVAWVTFRLAIPYVIERMPS
jgi:lipopolysaccharide transport system permease protein